jgi:formate dehydrogenase iron-sulfur subunit
MHFGDRDEMVALAEKRLKTVKKKHPKAMLLDPDDLNVIYLVVQDPALYSDYAVASACRGGMSRSVAIRKMMGPFARLMKV